MLGLSPDEFWDMTFHEFNWRLKGFSLLEELRFEKSMLNAYYSGYAFAPRKKGSKPMKPDKFVSMFTSEERKIQQAQARIDRINKIVEQSKKESS